MNRHSLNGNWTMHMEDGRNVVGKIPGSMLSFLMDKGKIEDPYYRMNELTALDLSKQDAEFSFRFEAPDSITGCAHQMILFHGIDTIAKIYLNGKKLGEADNFHRAFEYDVRGILTGNDNILTVSIKSPVKYIRQKDSEYHVGGSPEAMRGFPRIRKPHCMFGWDWGPRIPDLGIWGDVELLGWNQVRIGGIYITQRHVMTGEKRSVFLKTDIDIVTKTDTTDDVFTSDFISQNRQLSITLKTPGGVQYGLENHREFQVPDPELWWPNGLGEQPLYKIYATLDEGGSDEEKIEKTIGLRTLTMRRDPDKWGESFAHEINGRTFFAMGADYIPEDNIWSRRSESRTKKLLTDCRDAHFNVIRVWGGGFYPDDYFYDICDKLGLVVWQDLMFACANYRLTSDFERNITSELRENIRRIRHHACLGLLCGNNEMEMFASRFDFDGNETTQADYLIQNETLIPKICREEAPDIFYWPSSPSSGGQFKDPNAENRGDVHYWDVWHGDVPFSAYRGFHFRYLSEFGFQSFPCMETIRSFTLPKDRNIFSRVMEMHQRNSGANGKILRYLSATYLYPDNFETLIYASQLLQAEAVRYGVEHFRRCRNDERCMGTIYWQLNDIWPGASWSSVDYYGRFKALMYYARRFFAPVLISCDEKNEVTERSSVIEEPAPYENSAQLFLSNETRKNVTGTVSWELRRSDSSVIQRGEDKITAAPFSAASLERMKFEDLDILEDHLSYRFIRDNKSEAEDETASLGTVLFTAPKHYNFADPKLRLEKNGDIITVTSEAFAKSVEVYSENGYIRTDDNFFDMEKGVRTVRLIEGDASELAVRSVYNIR